MLTTFAMAILRNTTLCRELIGDLQPAFLSLIASIVVATPVLFITLVLFGAPISTHHWHTLLCALHVSFLTVLPLVYVHGVDGSTWQEIIAMLRPIDEVYGCMIGTFLGAWMGAVPIPLDWDREWQKWPVTIVTGAYVGFAVGKLAGATVLKGKKIAFE
jgi:phosphatidylinositol glycan class F